MGIHNHADSEAFVLNWEASVLRADSRPSKMMFMSAFGTLAGVVFETSAAGLVNS